MSDDMMTIREMCDVYGVTARTLRFYEAKELLFPVREGQKRLFSNSDRARLKLILRGKRFGFSLEEIRQLLDLYARDDKQQNQLQSVCDAGRRRLADMKTQHEELTESIRDLKEMLMWGESEIVALDQQKDTD